MSLGLLSLSIPGDQARAEAARDRRPESGGCVYFVVRDSATGKPLGYANCYGFSLRKGNVTDSLGRCLLCGLPPGRVVLVTKIMGYSPRRDTVSVRSGHIDTLRVRLARQSLPPGTVLDTSARYGSR